LPAAPERALAFLKLALEKVDALGATYLGGVLYASVGTMTLKPPTQQERDQCVQVLGEVAADAARRGITLGIEPVNRYETYVYNSVADTLALIEAIGASNLTLHVDTYHMNIEERGFFEPIKQAGQRLSYVHASESDRGLVGMGNVHWDDFFAGLATINYRGPLVLESFAMVVRSMVAAICLWRPSPYSPQQLVGEGVAFLREKAAQAGLL
jgi:D-psicose/D-tagatose/L-ribulose 3-epimerase